MAKILKNTTGSPIEIADTGVTLAASPTTYTIPQQDYDLWGASTNVISYITAATIVVNDGYDDLKPIAGLMHLQEEGLPRASALNTASQAVTTTNSTLTCTASSRLLTFFTGTVAGQIVKLPDATTLNTGHRFEFCNESTQVISIRNNGNSVLVPLQRGQKVVTLLENNSTANGDWCFTLSTNFGVITGPTIAIGHGSTAGPGKWLENEGVPTNNGPIVVAGSRVLTALSASTQVNGTVTFTVFLNGAALETLTLTNPNPGNGFIQASKLNLSYLLTDLDKLSVQVTSGTAYGPLFILWL